jgi:hypothetical protein
LVTAYILHIVAPEIFESSGFMDALNSTDTGIGRRKRKLSAAQVPSKQQASTGSTVPVSPDDKKVTPPSVSSCLITVLNIEKYIFIVYF